MLEVELHFIPIQKKGQIFLNNMDKLTIVH